MIFVISVLAGIIPMLIYPVFLYALDRYEKEPIPLLIGLFVWGFVPAAIFSIISQLILGTPFMFIDPSGALSDVVGAVVLAPITEEIFKGVAVWLAFVLFRREFDGVMDGIVYGSLVGFGFAAVENILYFATTDVPLGGLIFARAFLFGLNHAFFTSLIGIGFGVARHAKEDWVRIAAPLLGLLGAILTHAFHNGMVTASALSPLLICVTIIGDYIGIFLVFLTIIFSVRRERDWIVEQLKPEIGQIMTPEQYEVISHPMRRYGARFAALTTGGLGLWNKMGQYYEAVSELAYRKYAREQRGDEGAREDELKALRTKAASLSKELDESLFLDG